MGIRANPPPPLQRRPRIPGDQTAHPSPQRALPRLPRPRRDPVRVHIRQQDGSLDLDHHRPDPAEHPGHV